MYTAGDYAALRKPGLVFHALTVEVDDLSAAEFGHCVYRGKPPTEEQMEDASYAPRCAAATTEGYSSYFSTVRADRPSSRATQYGLVSTLEADYWTQMTEFEGAATGPRRFARVLAQLVAAPLPSPVGALTMSAWKTRSFPVRKKARR